ESQDALLKLWSDRVFEPAAGLKLDTIMFVCAGTFVDIERSIARDGQNLDRPVGLDALKLTAVRSEWANHLSAVAYVPRISEDALARIIGWLDLRRDQCAPGGVAPAT